MANRKVTQTFTNATARGLAVPDAIGQLGIQLDTGVSYKSIGLSAGNWNEQIGYKKYVALLTQSGTNAPTAIVLENTLGAVTFNYVGVGSYQVLSSALFTINKTWVVGASSSESVPNSLVIYEYITGNEIALTTIDSTGAGSNGVLTISELEIRVYL